MHEHHHQSNALIYIIIHILINNHFKPTSTSDMNNLTFWTKLSRPQTRTTLSQIRFSSITDKTCKNDRKLTTRLSSYIACMSWMQKMISRSKQNVPAADWDFYWLIVNSWLNTLYNQLNNYNYLIWNSLVEMEIPKLSILHHNSQLY